MICYEGQIEVQAGRGVDIVDITDRLAALVSASGVRTGSMHATCIGSTGSLTAIEYEPGVVSDLARAINEMAPPGRDYAHERAWADGNGHSHVQAALVGPSLVIAVRGGKLSLGTWQQVVAINHDIKSRNRRIEVTVIGS